MEVAINNNFGMFELSGEVIECLGEDWEGWELSKNEFRSHPKLIEYIKKFKHSNPDISIIDIPDDVEWYIDEYDGLETIHETHRIWYADDKSERN